MVLFYKRIEMYQSATLVIFRMFKNKPPSGAVSSAFGFNFIGISVSVQGDNS